jgi:hypothetical protein
VQLAKRKTVGEFIKNQAQDPLIGADIRFGFE